MNLMFSNCSSLSFLDLSSFDIANVTNLSGLFWNCYNLSFLDLSSFDTKNVTDINGMFHKCNNLTKIILNKNYDNTKIINQLKDSGISPKIILS